MILRPAANDYSVSAHFCSHVAPVNGSMPGEYAEGA